MSIFNGWSKSQYESNLGQVKLQKAAEESWVGGQEKVLRLTRTRRGFDKDEDLSCWWEHVKTGCPKYGHVIDKYPKSCFLVPQMICSV